ncbi:MAG TPA: hypothetical protein VF544_24065 [Pyrinomonadaceae bacterium]|jgi:hypothetical protein
MGGNRGKSSASRRKPLDLWQAPAAAGEPLICLATTFTFDAQFFETECLGRFLQMDSHPSETEAVGYLIEREEKLASVRACVLVDRRHAQLKESLRWDVLSVLVTGAAQHAKISILCWADHVRVIVGSGNLTEWGYRKNLEVFGSLEAARSAAGQVQEILSCVEFVEGVATLAPGSVTRPGPKRRTLAALADLRTHIHDWPQAHARVARVFPVFGSTASAVLAQVRKEWPSGSPPRAAEVLSPFFDDDSNSPEVVAGLCSVLAKRRPRSIDFYFSSEELPDGRTRVRAPLSLVRAASKVAEVRVFKVPPEQDGEFRRLHAKILSLWNDDWWLLLTGSSNFTRAGFGLEDSRANLEANLAYLVRMGSAEARALEQTWPEIGDELDVNDSRLLWEPAFEEEGAGAANVALPGSFQEALYDAGSNPARLVLSLGDKLPARWRIKVPEGEELLSWESWQIGGEDFIVPWENKPVPFVLAVEWQGRKGEYSADWPVNVVEPGHLPPPEALRDLKLEELIEILSSTRPLHSAAAHVLRKRLKHTAGDIQLDPHKRVNTETFLLRRTKRVAIALERLRLRLERPVMNVEALDWRLKGPVGPMAVADAFGREARTADESLFFLAELALMLSRVRVEKTASGGLPQHVVRKRIRLLISEIEELVSPLLDPEGSALKNYVREALRRAHR